uniref:Ras-associating domain-containing protein n=1 Tax=Clastoptera arizonana TaxID=38151 RepID=A0A1B6DG70_9HEMI
MWKCHKCGKPVYFAERKQSLGYDWHPECLRCEECGKRLNPGQHAEHKGVPYCHVPCYGALFGPQLYGHGTRVESHTSFGKVENKSCGPNMPRSHLESKLKVFNQFYDGKSGEVRSREVNGRLVLEGAIRIHWGVLGVIHLKENDDQRTVVTVRKRNSCRSSVFNMKTETVVDINPTNTGENNLDNNTRSENNSQKEEEKIVSPLKAHNSLTLPTKLDMKAIVWDELDDLLLVERSINEGDKMYQTMPVSINSSSFPEPIQAENISLNDEMLTNTAEFENDEYSTKFEKHLEERIDRVIDRSYSVPEGFEMISDEDEKIVSENSVVKRRTGSTAIKRRSGKRRERNSKLKRRCSINGHFYNRETSFFTPPFGSQMSVWITSLVSTIEVINLMLDKYKVDSKPHNFALFVVRDNGEQRRLTEDEYPLLVRVMLGPHEDVAKLYLMDGHNTDEISCEVAQFLNLSTTECRAILLRYNHEEERETKRIKAKYAEMRRRMILRMDELKVRL